MQRLQLRKYACIFTMITNCREHFLFLWGNAWAVVRKAAFLYTLMGAYYFLVFTQISQNKQAAYLTVFFTVGSLGKHNLSWSKGQDKEWVDREKTNFSRHNVKQILGVPRLASTWILFSARPSKFPKEISNVYLEHRKCSENSSLDASRAENTACYGSISYYQCAYLQLLYPTRWYISFYFLFIFL